ncbi:MAG TPA: hypothetical protein DIS90_05245 [Cytophagales bacterium]|nr:hypothetical protein [Cytophagales bacterium]
MLIISPSVYGQFNSPQNDKSEEESEIRIGLRYASDYYYMGRADSAKAPYLTPSIAYYHKSGFSLRSALSYLTASGEGRVDLYTISGGYDYYGEKTAIGISISEYIFSDQSYAVQAEMSTYLNMYGGYDFSIFMLYADASLGFSDDMDVFTGVEINRTFYALKNRLRITPAIYMNAGSQHYYNAYYTQRSNQTGSGKGKGKGAAQPISTGSIRLEESDQFQILDYEADLQLSYKVNNLRVYVSTTWTFPIHPSTVVSDQGTYEEELKNGFYWSTGISYTIK